MHGHGGVMKRWTLTWFATVAFFFAVPTIAWSQAINNSIPGTSSNAPTDYAPVTVEGRGLFDVMGSSGLSAAERADKINRLLTNLIARPEAVRPFNKQDLIDEDQRSFRSGEDLHDHR